jgi:hypothetical protein
VFRHRLYPEPAAVIIAAYRPFDRRFGSWGRCVRRIEPTHLGRLGLARLLLQPRSIDIHFRNLQ